MILMIMVGLGALTMVLMQSKKNAIQIQMRDQADRDIARAVEMIQSIVTTPAGCNVNFIGKTFTSDSFSTSSPILKCTSGSCNPKTSSNSATAINISSTNWNMFEGEASLSKARLISATFSPSVPSLTKPTLFTLVLTFEKNLGLNGTTGTVTTSRPQPVNIMFSALHVKTKNPITGFYTVMPGTTIQGCASSSSSTIVF